LANTAFAIDQNTILPADAILIKNANALVRALAAAEAGICKDPNGQVKPCDLNVYDLFCKETGGLDPAKNGLVAEKPGHLCTYTNEWAAKTVNISGTKADAIYKALDDAKLKMSCSGLDANYKTSCNTRMQNINCFASGVNANNDPVVSCAVIPKYHSFTATPPANANGSNSAVIDRHDVPIKRSEQGVPLDKDGYPVDGNWERTAK
jgi:hypothetical protein